MGYQWLLDAGNPYLNTAQRWQRARVQGFGSLLSFAGGIAAGKGAAALIGASFGGPVGFVVGVGISIAWDVWAAPWIYDNIGAIPTRNLAPLFK